MSMDLSAIDNFQDAVVTVMGLGRYKRGSGLGLTKWLMRHGAQVVITDLKDAQELKESVDMVMEWHRTYRDHYPDRQIYQPIFVLGEHRKEDFVDVDCVVMNPGVPSEAEFVAAAKERNIPIESDASLFFRYYPHPVIAVTGTKDKTTTTLLLGEMLRGMDAAALTAGNVKSSPLDTLDDLLLMPSPTPVVLEFSSWMLESMKGAWSALGRGADIAVITNVYPEHLGRYANYEAYVDSKRIMLACQSPEQVAVLNYDQPDVRGMEADVKGRLFWFGKNDQAHDGCYLKNGMIVFRDGAKETLVLAEAEIALSGERHLENVLSAVCAAMLRGVPLAVIQQSLRTFVGTSDREELVREVDEIAYVNDSAATEPAAAAEAVAHFGAGVRKDVILLAGGDSDAAFAPLASAAAAVCKLVVVFSGKGGDALETLLAGKVPTERASTMREAVRKAHAAATRGDIVLLSPGAPAGSIFGSAFERGEQFREEVRNL